jgi:WD40 repeat protein
MVSVHNSLTPGGGKLLLHGLTTGQSKDGPETVQATSVKYLETNHGALLCLSSATGTQIYSEDLGTLLYYLPWSEGDSVTVKYHQGACYVPNLDQIVVGTSKGSLASIQLSSGGSVQLPESLPSSQTSEVSDLCYCPVLDAVVSVHNNGELRVWYGSASGPYTNNGLLPGAFKAPVKVVALGPRLLVADGPGSLLVFDALSLELQAEVIAHARCLSACSVREELNYVVTVGEDTTLNCWQVDPTSGEISLHHSTIVTDKLLTGVAIHAAGAAVTAYDSDQLYYVSF